jgi:hypothetical protein
MTPLVYNNYIVEKDAEYDALYRIARRNGFKECDLKDRDSGYLSKLIACRDLGFFPKSLRGRGQDELEAMLDDFHSLHQPPGV